MKWSFRIATVAGTVVRVHATFLILLAWVAASFFFREGTAQAVGALVFTVALFGCVLLHEFGHVFAARTFGIRTPDITLLPIGGLARLERMPEKPWQELIVALAGPAVNVVIAIVLLLVVGLPRQLDESLLDFTSPGALARHLMILNLWLVAFNLIPAFPMDGGRVLRALLAMVMPYARATNVAATIGQVFAGIAAVFALVWFNPILFLVALFVFLAARGESESVQVTEVLRDVTLDQAMITDFRSLAPDARLRDAVSALLAGSQHDFPVLLPGGGLVGILTRQALVRALAEHGPEHPVESFLVRDLPRVFPGTSLPRALQLLRESPLDVLPVLSSDEQQVLGLLTTENLGELLMVRSAVRTWNAHP